MKRFRNILLVCDERSLHDDVIGRAIWLAKANGARITLVDVVDSAPGELSRLFSALPGHSAQDVEYEVVEFHRDRLSQVAAPIKSEGILTSEVVLQGVPFVEIIRKVLRDGHDLVIKGAAGETEGKRLFFASNDLHLLRKCPCPVWMMKRSSQQRYARVLAAVDPMASDDQKDGLDPLIIELSTSMSQVDESQLHVVHVWKLDEEDSFRNSAFARVPKEDVDGMVDERRRQSERGVSTLLLRYPDSGGERQVHFLKGDARREIPAFAEEQQVDLIVMGTVGRTGIKGLIIGNTAEAILNQVQCSVLAVKPAGFRSPVTLEKEEEAVMGLRSA